MGGGDGVQEFIIRRRSDLLHWHRCGADIMMKEPSSLSTVQQHWMPIKEDGGLVITADPEYKYFQQGLVAPLHVVSAVDASTSALR